MNEWIHFSYELQPLFLFSWSQRGCKRDHLRSPAGFTLKASVRGLLMSHSGGSVSAEHLPSTPPHHLTVWLTGRPSFLSVGGELHKVGSGWRDDCPLCCLFHPALDMTRRAARNQPQANAAQAKTWARFLHCLFKHHVKVITKLHWCISVLISWILLDFGSRKFLK